MNLVFNTASFPLAVLGLSTKHFILSITSSLTTPPSSSNDSARKDTIVSYLVSKTTFLKLYLEKPSVNVAMLTFCSSPFSYMIFIFSFKSN